MSLITVLVPTANRPEMVDRLIHNLAEQTRLPDEILFVDGLPEKDETKKIVAKLQYLFPDNLLRRVESKLGLTLQRNVGIDSCTSDLICMLDDDVLLEPDCLEVMEQFMLSKEAENFGGVGAYITNEYGKDFYKYHHLYRWLGIYEELKPGRWLYCGDFLQLSTLKPFEGIYPCQFLSGCGAIYKRQVLTEIRPDSNLAFQGEDKHSTLRMAQKYKLGILGNAKLRHDHVKGGVRKSQFRDGIQYVRNIAVMLKDCDPNPSTKRYLIHLLYQPLDLLRMTISYILTGRWRTIDWVLGLWAGWLWNLVQPPRSR